MLSLFCCVIFFFSGAVFCSKLKFPTAAYVRHFVAGAAAVAVEAFLEAVASESKTAVAGLQAAAPGIADLGRFELAAVQKQPKANETSVDAARLEPILVVVFVVVVVVVAVVVAAAAAAVVVVVVAAALLFLIDSVVDVIAAAAVGVAAASGSGSFAAAVAFAAVEATAAEAPAESLLLHKSDILQPVTPISSAVIAQMSTQTEELTMLTMLMLTRARPVKCVDRGSVGENSASAALRAVCGRP